RGADGGQTGFFNSALLFDASGEVSAHYRKQKLFVYADEQRHYSPGDAPVVVEVKGVRLAPFICFDLRYPELFRAVASYVDAMLLIANWPRSRRMHWDVLCRARAIENQCFFLAVNRTGEGGGLEYDGGSVAYGPFGELVGEGPGAVVEIDPERVGEVRRKYPYVEDLRFGPLAAAVAASEPEPRAQPPAAELVTPSPPRARRAPARSPAKRRGAGVARQGRGAVRSSRRPAARPLPRTSRDAR